jgi:hypothetical protein
MSLDADWAIVKGPEKREAETVNGTGCEERDGVKIDGNGCDVVWEGIERVCKDVGSVDSNGDASNRVVESMRFVVRSEGGGRSGICDF